MTSAKVKKVLEFYRELDPGGYSPDARCKPYWHRENFSHFLRHDDFRVIPVTVEFWPSVLCNSRCSLCPYRRNGARSVADSVDIETDDTTGLFAEEATARDVAAQCRELGVLSVLLTGGGEPFMNPDVAQIAKAFKDEGLAVGVYSNGTVASREDAIQRIAELKPRFVRLSVNAGSEAEHCREYNLRNGWETLMHNAIYWARSLGRETPLAFSWVLTGQEGRATYEGAAEFLRTLHCETNRPIAGHFRPKYIYYNDDGSVHRPERLDFSSILSNVEQSVRPHLKGYPEVEVQVNTYAIEVSGAAPYPQASFATGWATSFTHRGKGYITSELNGSRWRNTCWGSLEHTPEGTRPNLRELWFGAERERLWRLYAQHDMLPVYHKLTGLTNVLGSLRQSSPRPFREEEIDEFWRLFDNAAFQRPSNWDFI